MFAYLYNPKTPGNMNGIHQGHPAEMFVSVQRKLKYILMENQGDYLEVFIRKL